MFFSCIRFIFFPPHLASLLFSEHLLISSMSTCSFLLLSCLSSSPFEFFVLFCCFILVFDCFLSFFLSFGDGVEGGDCCLQGRLDYGVTSNRIRVYSMPRKEPQLLLYSESYPVVRLTPSRRTLEEYQESKVAASSATSGFVMLSL